MLLIQTKRLPLQQQPQLIANCAFYSTCFVAALSAASSDSSVLCQIRCSCRLPTYTTTTLCFSCLVRSTSILFIFFLLPPQRCHLQLRCTLSVCLFVLYCPRFQPRIFTATNCPVCCQLQFSTQPTISQIMPTATRQLCRFSATLRPFQTSRCSLLATATCQLCHIFQPYSPHFNPCP